MLIRLYAVNVSQVQKMNSGGAAPGAEPGLPGVSASSRHGLGAHDPPGSPGRGRAWLRPAAQKPSPQPTEPSEGPAPGAGARGDAADSRRRTNAAQGFKTETPQTCTRGGNWADAGEGAYGTGGVRGGGRPASTQRGKTSHQHDQNGLAPSWRAPDSRGSAAPGARPNVRPPHSRLQTAAPAQRRACRVSH